MVPIPRIGTEFAGYRIEALLGRGGMGFVYRAEHPRLGTRIALKLLAPELADDEAFRERFVRESRLAASINHPAIITIYDAGEWTGVLYIAMRYVAGGDLRALLRHDGKILPARTVRIVSQIAGALDAAHELDLVHRDVKPANVLLETSGGPSPSELAYLSDFGVTKRSTSAVSPTATGDLLGTIDYVAPEQIEGKDVDGRADLYSLGCLAFECLTGSVPFERESEAAVLWAHMQEEPPRASARAPELPGGIDDILARALAKSPGDRLPSGAELAEALRTSLGPAGLEAEAPVRPAPRRGERGRGARGRRPLAVLVAAAVGLAIGSGVTAGLFAARGGSESHASTVTVTSTKSVTAASPGSNLAPLEQELLRHVPAVLADRCRAASPPSSDFDATLTCRTRASVSVSYSHARSGPRLGDYFIARVARAGVSIAVGGILQPTGSCADGRRAVNGWVQLDLAGHRDADSLDPEGSRKGRVLCYRRQGRNWFEWTYPQLAIYSLASAPDFQTLYGWWSRDGGPL
jgi:serine/threonine-protein kinase